MVFIRTRRPSDIQAVRAALGEEGKYTKVRITCIACGGPVRRPVELRI
jgi:hypothetical protein